MTLDSQRLVEFVKEFDQGHSTGVIGRSLGVPYDARNVLGQFSKSLAQRRSVRHEHYPKTAQVRVTRLNRFSLPHGLRPSLEQ
jgi:hypothetical protein